MSEQAVLIEREGPVALVTINQPKTRNALSGPVIDGLRKPVQIVQMGATVSDLVNHAALAAYGALNNQRK